MYEVNLVVKTDSNLFSPPQILSHTKNKTHTHTHTPSQAISFTLKVPLYFKGINFFNCFKKHFLHIIQQQDWASTPPITSAGSPQNLRGVRDGDVGGL